MNGCVTPAATTLVIPPAVDIQATSFNPCIGDGVTSVPVTLTVTGGNGGPLYASFDNGATYLGANIFTTNLATGNSYNIIVKDSSGCVSVTEPITIANEIVPGGVTSSFAGGFQVSCNGSTNGTIDVCVAGGTGSYAYAWSNGATTEDVSNLAAGTYSVVITDALACTDTLNFTLAEPVALTSSATAFSGYNGYNISCAGNADGSADLTVNGGVTTYAYNWSNGATTQDISALIAGTYSVTITDANGCTTTSSLTLTEPAAMSATSTVTDILCFGNATGAANLSPVGGVTPYTFSWSNGNTTEDLSSLLSGSYSVTITDLNGCQYNSSLTINEPTDLITSGIATDLACFQNAGGSINLSASGATPGYSFNWSNGATTEDVNGLAAGNYSVTVTDANGCSDNLPFTLTEPSLLTTSITSLSDYNGYNISCNGSVDGSADILTAGGTSGYTYNWSNGAVTEDLAGVAAGSYSLTATDANGCTSNVSITLTQPNALALTSTQQDVLCNGFSTGAIDITMSGGVVPYTYAWSNSATTEDIANLTSGSYSVNTTDANGCVITNSFVIAQLAPVILSGTSQDPLCFGDNNGTVDLSVNGGSAPYTYSWSNGQTSQDLSSLVGGTYTVTVSDANNCTSTDTFVITDNTLLTSSVTSPIQSDGFNVTYPGGTDGSIELTVNGGVSPYTYQWNNGSNSEDQSNVPAGSYTVIITDGNGCTTTTSITLNEPYTLQMPTGFSPNADGSNDYFVVHGLEAYPNNTIEVFNRWGNEVYSTDDYMNSWTGMTNSGDLLPDGTYFVVLNINEGQIILKGYVDLRR